LDREWENESNYSDGDANQTIDKQSKLSSEKTVESEWTRRETKVHLHVG
jgi:hypothetical protein